ncbi:MAG: SOS response-associated peptidase [Candidatus Limnocylindria bacterium]
MCGRFSQRDSAEEIATRFAAAVATHHPGGQYNVAPTDEVSAVLDYHEERVVDTFRWGLVPVWADSPRQGARMINARAETVESSSTYRSALRERRCLIPADGFFEFVRADGRARPDPWFVHRADDAVMAFAGLWSIWRDPVTAARLYSCTILTTVPNELMSRLHHRMPVVVEPEDWDAWLAPSATADKLGPLLTPAADDLLEAYPVSPLVNDVRNEGPELIRPLVTDSVAG